MSHLSKYILFVVIVSVYAGMHAAGSKRQLESSEQDEINAKRHQGSSEEVSVEEWNAATGAWDLERIKYFMEQKGVKIDYGYVSEWTLLHDAARGGKRDVLKYLIEERNIDPRLGRYTYSALHDAAMNGHVNIAQYLVEDVGMDPDLMLTNTLCPGPHEWTATGPTPLSVAVNMGRLDFVKYLVSKGVDVDRLTSCYQRKPILFGAIHRGDNDMLKFLVHDAGADINKRDSYGWAPIHVAVCEGDEKAFHLLLSLKDPKTGERVCKWRRGIGDDNRHSVLSLTRYFDTVEHGDVIDGKKNIRAWIKDEICKDLPEDAECAMCSLPFDEQDHKLLVLTCCMNVLCAHDVAVLGAQDADCPFCRHPNVKGV